MIFTAQIFAPKRGIKIVYFRGLELKIFEFEGYDMKIRGNRILRKKLGQKSILGHSRQNFRPSYEVVYSWSQSFDQLMKNRIGQKYFAEFLKGEYSDENILFWQACEELKREKNAEKIEEKVVFLVFIQSLRGFYYHEDECDNLYRRLEIHEKF